MIRTSDSGHWPRQKSVAVAAFANSGSYVHRDAIDMEHPPRFPWGRKIGSFLIT